jgi:hypothetical protein
MRLIIYAVFNKETNKRIFTSAYFHKCNEKMKALDNAENYEIRHKFKSI